MYRRSIFLCATIAAVALLVVACDGGGCSRVGGRGSGGSETGVIFRLNVINPIASTGTSYQINVTWSATPNQVAAEGSGTTDTQLVSKQYSGTVGGPGAPDAHGYQVSYGGFPALHAGTWTFTVATDLELWTMSCQLTLPQDSALLYVNFTHNVGGCKTGTQFP